MPIDIQAPAPGIPSVANCSLVSSQVVGYRTDGAWGSDMAGRGRRRDGGHIQVSRRKEYQGDQGAG